MIEITVYGTPAPQGSKRFLGTKGGKGIMVESSEKVKPWREAVKYAAREVMESRELSVGVPGDQPNCNGSMSGPVQVQMVFTLAKPKSAPKRRTTWPDKTPDLSKLVRSTEDALVDAGVIEDDARIVSCVARKVFPGTTAHALNVPGAVILIWSVLENL